MNQNLWGPKYWFTLHTMTFEFPKHPTEKDRKAYHSIFTSLQYVLPCSVCRRNYKNNLAEHPIENHLYSRKAIVHWLIDIHNKVNAETGKRHYSYDEVIDIYSKLLNRKIELYDDEQSVYKPLNKTGKVCINWMDILFALLIIAIIIKKIRKSRKRS